MYEVWKVNTQKVNRKEFQNKKKASTEIQNPVLHSTSLKLPVIN